MMSYEVNEFVLDRVLPKFVDIVQIDDVKGLVVSLALWLGVLINRVR